MAKNYLSVQDLANGKIWLKHIFFNALSANRSKAYFFYRDHIPNVPIAEACKVLYKIITTHDWDLALADHAIAELAHEEYSDVPYGSLYSGNRIIFSEDTLASILADMCAKCRIYWDDLSHTPQELTYLKKTKFGKALWDFECFLSQDPANAASTPTTKTASTSQTGGTSQSSTTSTGAPANGYKSSGPQSGNVINLLGQPGVKSVSQNSGGLVYCIEADKIGKNTPNAFVKPLNSAYQTNSANKVCFGSGNGYTDCKCWFDDLNKAEAFLKECQNKFGSSFTNIHIAKAKADPNGYFWVKTEFGDCAIKASKLNEEAESKMIDDEPFDETAWKENVRKAYEALEAFMR